MSTFAVEVADLLRGSHPVMAYAYVTASIIGGLLAVVVGAALLHRAPALALPLGEGP